MPTHYVSRIAGLVTVLNGFVIAGNDLVAGVQSSLPVVSAAMAVVFVLSGLFVWRLGERLHQLGREIPPGNSTYRALARLMTVAFLIVALVMFSILYGLWERISQGAAIFG